MHAKHPRRTCSFTSELKPLMEFLAEHTKNVKCPMVLTHIFNKYRDERNMKSLPGQIQRNFRTYLSPIIHTFSEFEDEVLVKIFYATSTPVEEEFLKKLRITAEVTVDESQRICKYESGSLRLNGKHVKLSGYSRLKRRSTDPSYGRERKTNNNNTKRRSEPFSFAPNPVPAPVLASVPAPVPDPFSVPAHRMNRNPHGTAVATNSSIPLSPSNWLGMSAVPGINPICNPMITPESLVENQFFNMMSVFVNSMTSMMESQQHFLVNMVEKIYIQSLQKKDGPSETSEIPDMAEPPEIVETTTSLPHFLKFSKCILSFLNCEELNNLSKHYDKYLESLGTEDAAIPNEKLILALQVLFSVSLSANVVSVAKPNERTNAKHFISLIENFVSSELNYPQFRKLDEQLKKKIASLEENSRIPIENLKLAFEAALAIVSKELHGNESEVPESVDVKQEITS
ncbi:hypothetical protein CRE_02937 [Caenorhabditis remanei]|uniref:SPK domain-containing protein n=1 Tax=Caenorhabditis remanei TaxID=31234 RepID=E3LWR9_CAERE|nr:hypothetical protein CRE_02937 [Caenorhabditis remanei]